jgi:hypothetical protein
MPSSEGNYIITARLGTRIAQQFERRAREQPLNWAKVKAELEFGLHSASRVKKKKIVH